TQRRTRGRKLPVAATFARIERDGGKPAGLVEVVVDVVGIIGTIPRSIARLAPEARLDHRHQREEVADVALVKRAGTLREYDFIAVRQATHDDARGVAPQDVDADLQLGGGFGITVWGRMLAAVGVGGRAVAALLDAKLTVWVATRLARL